MARTLVNTSVSTAGAAATALRTCLVWRVLAGAAAVCVTACPTNVWRALKDGTKALPWVTRPSVARATPNFILSSWLALTSLSHTLSHALAGYCGVAGACEFRRLAKQETVVRTHFLIIGVLFVGNVRKFDPYNPSNAQPALVMLKIKVGPDLVDEEPCGGVIPCYLCSNGTRVASL